MISTEARDAFNKLKDSGIVEIRSELLAAEDGAATFRCLLPVPQPNPEGLPEKVAFEVRLPEAFPLSKVFFVPADPAVDGFPHQAARSRKGELCLLNPERDYPTKAGDRLIAYVNSAVKWIADAATGQLLAPGEPWELPDFGPSQAGARLVFVESSETLSIWTGRVGQSGTVSLADHARRKGVVPTLFKANGTNSDQVQAPTLSSSFCRGDSTTPADWILLPSFLHTRHRAPRTFGELQELCARSDVDLWAVLRRARKRPDKDGYHYILLGAPIPTRVGGQPVEVHWQPIAIPLGMLEAARNVVRGRRGNPDNDRPDGGEIALRSRELPWGEAVNVAGERLRVRGVLHEQARRTRACVIGCGAIGSLVAEHLARGGVSDLALFDDERLEFQNLTRHVLTVDDVGDGKVVGLARRLNGFYPSTTIVPLPFAVPLAAKAPKAAWDAVDGADAIIDCTTSDSAFEWCSKLGREKGKVVLHVYMNAGARMLTICCSGRHIGCSEVARRLYGDIAAGRAPFTREEYDANAEEVEPGAGCWRGTFPARGADIAALVTTAIPIIERLLSRERQSRGVAFVMRRNDLDDPIVAKPVVELVLHREYR